MKTTSIQNEFIGTKYFNVKKKTTSIQNEYIGTKIFKCKNENYGFLHPEKRPICGFKT